MSESSTVEAQACMKGSRVKKSRAVILALTVLLVALLAGPAMAQAETTELVSVSTDGTKGNGDGGPVAISGDGSVVAFSSLADNLVADDGNLGTPDIFVRDLVTGTTQLVTMG